MRAMTAAEGTIAVITLISFAFGVYFFVDSRYALAENVKQIEQRLDYKIKSDQVDQIQTRLWKIEDRYKNMDKMPAAVKDDYRDLQDKKQKLQDGLKSLEKK
jgi:septation ring formation regulator EzrA